jgi:hypothetical protein
MQVSWTSRLGIVCSGCTLHLLVAPAEHEVSRPAHGVSESAQRLGIESTPPFTDPEDSWPESGKSPARHIERLDTLLREQTSRRPTGAPAGFVASGRHLYLSTPKHDPPEPPRV